VKVKDLGDCVGKDRDEMFAEAEELAYQAVKAGKFFTMIGGDHSVTIPVHRGVNRAVEEDFGIIHIDAHFDLCHEMHGDILSHGSTERRATELSHVGDSDHLYFLGIRSIESDELEFYQNNKINVLSAADVDHLGVPAALERMVSHMKRFSKVYITLDIDCLDPAYAAGTGTPQFGGLTARQLLDLLKGLFDGLNIIGMDVVEVAPRLDPSLAALFAARKIITECWAHHYFKNLARA
jgi:agmatinase